MAAVDRTVSQYSLGEENAFPGTPLAASNIKFATIKREGEQQPPLLSRNHCFVQFGVETLGSLGTTAQEGESLVIRDQEHSSYKTRCIRPFDRYTRTATK
ncbi:hypothetical protein ACOME3_010103 [Neoechinorhynchus agilis]